MKKTKELQKDIEEPLLKSYNRLRSNSRNGLAIVEITRDACGGCYSKIPSQQQINISRHKKIIVCEYCGKVLVDASIVAKSEI